MLHSLNICVFITIGYASACWNYYLIVSMFSCHLLWCI